MPANWMPSSGGNNSHPVSLERKSKCHHERRNSPSVASFNPIDACLCTTFSISMSSTLRRSSAEISPFASLARASLIFGGRSRLPTSSARKGAFVLCMAFTPWRPVLLRLRLRHCEERKRRSNPFPGDYGLLRFARNDERRHRHDLPATPKYRSSTAG